MTREFDCVVIGGGPAGCTTAALVAKAGHKTLLLEREKVPRFHVGESLMPETYWTLKRLGVLEKMREYGFEPKSGVQFVSHSGKESQPFFFRDHDPRESSTTWHVERDRFDQMLFENASELGADCRDETRVMGLDLRDDDEPHKLRIQTASGSTEEIEARVVVDGSGQSALIASKLGLREYNQRLRKASIWTYARGAKRCEDSRDNATIILHTNDRKAWFWYIPLANDVVSVGVVANNDYLLKNRGTPAETFEEELQKCDAVRERIADATLEGYHVAKEFSYWTHQHAGPGWVLVGDAFGFIDPVYSSGVFLAFKSGELAADAIIDGFNKNDLSAAQLGYWAEDFKKGAHWIRKLVHTFYTDEFSFGAFMKSHPEHRGNLTDLLIGRVFNEEVGRIFDDLDPRLEEARQAETA